MAFPSAWALVLLIRGEAGWGKRIQRSNSHNVSTKVPTFLADLISPHRPSSLTNEPKYHPLIRTLCDAARDLDPELKFTSIQVNKDSKYGLHCDSSNLGLSGFLGLGNFTGGWSYLGFICHSIRITIHMHIYTPMHRPAVGARPSLRQSYPWVPLPISGHPEQVSAFRRQQAPLHLQVPWRAVRSSVSIC